MAASGTECGGSRRPRARKRFTPRMLVMAALQAHARMEPGKLPLGADELSQAQCLAKRGLLAEAIVHVMHAGM